MTTPCRSSEERFALFQPRFESRTVRLEFGQSDVLKVVVAEDLLIGWDAGKDAVRRRSGFGSIDVFWRGKSSHIPRQVS